MASTYVNSDQPTIDQWFEYNQPFFDWLRNHRQGPPPQSGFAYLVDLDGHADRLDVSTDELFYTVVDRVGDIGNAHLVMTRPNSMDGSVHVSIAHGHGPLVDIFEIEHRFAQVGHPSEHEFNPTNGVVVVTLPGLAILANDGSSRPLQGVGKTTTLALRRLWHTVSSLEHYECVGNPDDPGSGGFRFTPDGEIVHFVYTVSI